MTPLIEAIGASKLYPRRGGLTRQSFAAVDNVSLAIAEDKPEIFTIIGASGSGKTTLSRMLLGLERASIGSVNFRGRPIDTLDAGGRRAFMAAVQPVFQNPFEAFNPLKKVDRFLRFTAQEFLGLRSKTDVDAAIDGALQKVGLSLAEVAGRHPHELSGGQLQRIAIARALIPNPKLILADEPVSMVDASLRMAIVNLLRHLRDELGVSVVYVTHDLATAYYISDRLMIMQSGRVVEFGPARLVLDAPMHPYSQLLKASVLSTEVGATDLDIEPRLVQLANVAVGAADAGTLNLMPDGRMVRGSAATA